MPDNNLCCCPNGAPNKFAVTIEVQGEGCCEAYISEYELIYAGGPVEGCWYYSNLAENRDDPCTPYAYWITLSIDEVGTETGPGPINTYTVEWWWGHPLSPKTSWQKSGIRGCTYEGALTLVPDGSFLCTAPGSVTITPIGPDQLHLSPEETQCLTAMLKGCDDPVAALEACIKMPFIGGPTQCCFPNDKGCGCEDESSEECDPCEHVGQPKLLSVLGCNCHTETRCIGGSPAASTPQGPPQQDGSCGAGCSTVSGRPSYSRNGLSLANQLIVDLQSLMRPDVPGVNTGGPGFVNLANGNLVLRIALPLGGAYDPVPILTYNSLNADEVDGDFGRGWIESFKRKVTSGVITRGSGTQFTYSSPVDNVYLPPGGVVNSLEYDDGNDTFTETQPDGLKLHYDTSANNGRLSTIETSGGQVWTVTYISESDRINKIVDPYGRLTTFSYDGNQKISGIRLSDGRLASFSVVSNKLVSLTTPEQCVYEFGYDNTSHRLTRFQDPESNSTTFQYDGDGWVKAIVRPDATRVTIAYEDWNTTEIVDEAGRVTTLLYDVTRHVKGYINPLGEQKQYSWQGGFLAEYADPRGNITTFSYYDLENRTTQLESIAFADGGRFTFVYGANDRIESLIDQNSSITTLIWDGYDRTALIDAANNVWTYSYDATGRIVSKMNPLGDRTTMHYDSIGQVDYRENPLSERTTYAYENGQPRRITNPLGEVTTYIRDDMNRVIQKVDARGNATSFTYDLNGRLESVTNALNETTTHQYDSRNLLISTKNALGETTSYGYDNRRNRTRITNPLGQVTTQAYDAASRLIAIENPLGEITTFAYDASGNLQEITNPLGEESVATYDEMNRLRAQRDARGNRTTFSYDLGGNRRVVEDALGHRSTTFYDSLNNVKGIQDASGYLTTYQYDAANLQVSVLNARGFATTAQYNPISHVQSIIDPLGYRTTFGYDRAGRWTSVQNAKGYTTSTKYDAVGNVTGIINPLGHITTFGYDALNRRESVLDPLGQITTTQFDGAGRVKSIENPLEFTTTFSYDAAGRRRGIQDAGNNRTTFSYDAAGRNTVILNALGHRTTVAYDAAGRRRALVDANSHRTTFQYDATGNVTTEVDPLGRRTTFTYTRLNQLDSKHDARNARVSYTYDRVGRLAGEDFSSGTDHAFTYDGVGNRLTMVDATGTTSYQYTARNEVQRVIPPTTSSVSYTYDEVGNRATMVVPITAINLARTTYAYDSANQLKSVTNRNSETTTFTFDAAGREATNVLANGVRVTYIYDAASQVTRIEQWKDVSTYLERLTYTYDNVGNRRQLTELGGSVVTWTYDTTYRLTNEHRSGATPYNTAHAYDPVGNRLVESVANGQRTTFTYDVANQLKTSVGPTGAGVTTYTYDGAGNLIEERQPTITRDLGWSVDNRLIVNDTETTRRYNADGLLIDVNEPDSVRTFNWDGQNLLSEVFEDSEDTYLTNYTQTPDLYGKVISHSGDDGSRFYLFDALGSTLGLTDAIKDLTFSFKYSAYGKIASFSGAGGTPFAWVGRYGYYADSTLGDGFNSPAYYVRQRFYNSKTAAWMSKDPFPYPPIKSGYDYAGNNPVLFSDPSGLTLLQCAMAYYEQALYYGSPLTCAGCIATLAILICGGPFSVIALLGVIALCNVCLGGVYFTLHCPKKPLEDAEKYCGPFFPAR